MSREQAERLGERHDHDTMLEARRRAIAAVRDLAREVAPGMTEEEGLDVARRVAARLFEAALEALPAAAALKDPKTRLQEWLQGRGHPLPAYTVLEVSGEPHEQSFRVRCDVPGLGLAAVADGSSRRRAEQEAAQRILEDPELKSAR